MDIPPSPTIYISNINDKIKKEVLKRQLYMALSQFGTIIDVVACRGNKLRGQAWVVFDDVASATNALRSMQGFPFFGKALKITFAKSKSDAVAMKEGSMEPRYKRLKREEKQQQRTAAAKAAAENRQQQQQQQQQANGRSEGGAPQGGGQVSSVLMAKQLPADCTQEMLKVLFERFTGFKEIRMAGQRGIAFIEFKDEVAARTALQALHGFKLSATDTLQLSYAKQ